MRHLSLPIGIFAVTCVLLANATPARATSYQTWVSGTGSDAGACPIAAPCRTFVFAFGLTNAGGVIHVVSPGDFGPLTINKSISIVAEATEAGIYSAAAGAAIRISAANIEVSLRGLTIDLFGSAGNAGIAYLRGKALHISNCAIRGTSNGIRFAPNLGANQLFVSDTVITKTVGDGLAVAPISGASAKVTLDRVLVEGAGGNGIAFAGITGGINATVRESVSSGSAGSGITATGNVGSPLNVMIDRSASVNNGNTGIVSDSAQIRIGDSTVSGNNLGLSAVNGGTILSFVTNKINANFTGGDGAPTGTLPYK
jgi:hypothetical protein